jgi:hypothetical protein
MKNFRFVLGVVLGVFLSTTVFFLALCKSELPEKATTETTAVSSKFLKDIEPNVKAFKLEVDNIQYIVVVNGRDGGVAITEHQ